MRVAKPLFLVINIRSPMNFLQNVGTMEKLHTLILQKKTGTSKELAKQLGISRASLYILIDELNDLNLHVAYSRKLETFYYESDTKATVLFQSDKMNGKDKSKTTKGKAALTGARVC